MKLKIATKIGILASILVLVTAFVIGKVAERETIRYNINNEVETTYRDKLLVDKVPFAQEVMDTLQVDVREEANREIHGRVILSHLAAQAGWPLRQVDALENAREKPWEADWIEVLIEDVWKKSLYNKKDYIEISLIDRSGEQIVRVYREDGVISSSSQPIPLASLELESVTRTVSLGETVPNDKTHRPVFLSYIRLLRDQEGGELVTPLCPVIHAAAPIYTPTDAEYPGLPESLNLERYGKVFGLVSITMKMDRVLGRLAQVTTREDSRAKGKVTTPVREQIYVTDGDGYFLNHPDPRKLFGMEPEIREQQAQHQVSQTNIVDLYPQLKEFYQSSDTTGKTRILHERNQAEDEGYFVKARLGPGTSPRTLGLAMVAPYSYLQAKARSGNKQIVQATIALGLASSLIALLAVTWYLRRLKPLAVAATKIAGGDYEVPLPPNTGDEIGEVAQAFGEMIKQIREREEDLRKHKEGLEREVERRTEALRKARDALAAHSEALKKTNVELAVARDRALEAGRAKSEFFAKMSHELKSPLTVIILAAESLEEEISELGEEYDLSAEIQDILVAAWTLYEQITSILDISKIEAGKLELNLSTFDIRELIESEISRPIRYLARKRGNRFEVRIDEAVQEIHSDRTLVKNALYNLLSNACKFTQEGTVTLEVFPNKTDDSGREEVVFRVRDTGIGMDESQVKRVFQVFSQVDSSTSSKYGGHGLGLANVRHYCEMLGGRVTVESKPGKGSTFTIHLPTKTPAEMTERVAVTREDELLGTTVGSNSVLVIDDDPQWRESMLRTLTREGFHTITASSGEEGLRRARQFKPAVITLDVSMPSMDGWRVLAELKGDPETADIPVIMLTLVENQKVAYKLGASDYLTKPIDRNRLSQVLRKYLEKPATAPVLIVEDDPEVREVMRRFLETEGWTVMEACDGIEALDRLKERKPGLILLDLLMPRMNGFEFIEEIDKLEELRTIPVVVVTAMSLTEEDRERLRGHAEKILSKDDFGRKELLEEVSRLAKECLRQTPGSPSGEETAHPGSTTDGRENG